MEPLAYISRIRQKNKKHGVQVRASTCLAAAMACPLAFGYGYAALAPPLLLLKRLLVSCLFSAATSPNSMAMDASCWISLLEHDLLDSDLPHGGAFLWCPQQQQHSLSVENDSSRGDSMNQDKSCSKKRARDECSTGAGAKASREKMRRDKLNDRFMELSTVLEPDKPPKTDKASILQDAARILSQLRVETRQLRDANCQLQETIKELKGEKNELRDEKLTLKSEKERLEKQIKSVNVVPSYMSHPSTVHAGAYSSLNDCHSKLTSFGEVPITLTMSQWMPQATVDVSNDHVLRPPVA